MNFGAGGRTMLKNGDNPYWTTGPLKQALASKPGIVVLMLGTNDAKFRNWGPLHAEFPVDYKSMIDAFAALTPKPEIYLMVPPPLYQNGRYGMNQTVINTLFPGDGPAGVRTLAKDSGLPTPIDLFSLWQSHCPVVAAHSWAAPPGVPRTTRTSRAIGSRQKAGMRAILRTRATASWPRRSRPGLPHEP